MAFLLVNGKKLNVCYRRQYKILLFAGTTDDTAHFFVI